MMRAFLFAFFAVCLLLAAGSSAKACGESCSHGRSVLRVRHAELGHLFHGGFIRHRVRGCSGC